MVALSELVHQNFTSEVLTYLGQNIRQGAIAYQKFMASNYSFLGDGADLRGRLQGFAVNRQFELEAAKTASSFFVSRRPLNAFKTRALILTTTDFNVSVCRTMKPSKLPCRANYKLELAQGNREYDQQVVLFQDESKQLSADLPLKYAVLGYRIEGGEVLHLNLMIPDSSFESVLYAENLLEYAKRDFSYVPSVPIEETLASLKAEYARQSKAESF